MLQNEGLLDKVVLLKGYKDLAHGINSLGLPQLEIDGVFIQKKLQTNGNKKAAAATAAAAVGSTAATPSTNSPKGKQSAMQAQDNEKARPGKSNNPNANITKPVTPVKKPRPLDPEQVRLDAVFCIISFGLMYVSC